MTARITDGHVAAWLRDGYTLVEDFLSDDEVRVAREEMREYYPSWAEYQAEPDKHRATVENPFGMNEFPYRGDALNRLTLHAEVLRFVEEQLGTPDIRLATAVVWGKYAPAKGMEQGLHVDFGNNTLAYPRDDGPFRQIPFILYLTDVTADLGPTCVVSQQVTGTDVATLMTPTFHEDRQTAPAERRRWYAAEQPVTVRAGTLLIYGMRTFHRGTAMSAPDGVRLSVHMVFRAAQCQFMGWRSPAKDAGKPEMHRFLTRATPRERELLGFPAPGDPYWNDETLAGVAARYPGMDMRPYREASNLSPGT